MTTVVRLRGTIVSDGYGGNTVDFTDPDRLTIEGGALAPLTLAEKLEQGRDAAYDGWTYYLRGAWADIAHHDRIEALDETYEVDGRPNRWQSPFGGDKGMTAQLRRIEGLPEGD